MDEVHLYYEDANEGARFCSVFNQLQLKTQSLPLESFCCEPKYTLAPKIIIFLASSNKRATIAEHVNQVRRQDKKQNLFLIYIIPHTAIAHNEFILRKINEQGAQRVDKNPVIIPMLDMIFYESMQGLSIEKVFENFIVYYKHLHTMQQNGASASEIRKIKLYMRRNANVRTFARLRRNKETSNVREIRTAKTILRSPFSLFLQPIFSVKDLQVACGEILSRRIVFNGNKQLPRAYIRYLQKEGKMAQYTNQILYLLASKLEEYQYNRSLNLSFLINIPASIAFSRTFRSEVVEFFEKTKIPRNAIGFEIYDYRGIDLDGRTIKSIAEWREEGVQYGFDRFNPFRDNLSMLLGLSPMFIKFSRSSMLNLRRDREDYKQLKKIIGRLKKQNVHTILSGIESAQDLVLARRAKADFVQGFFLSIPDDISVFADFFNIDKNVKSVWGFFERDEAKTEYTA